MIIVSMEHEKVSKVSVLCTGGGVEARRGAQMGAPFWNPRLKPNE